MNATNKIIFFVLAKKDPTGTAGLRRGFSADATRRYRALKSAVWQSIAVNDAFGLREKVNPLRVLQRNTFNITPIPPRSFEYERSDQKIEKFMEWLNDQEAKSTLEVIIDSALPRGKVAWSDKYVYSSYQKGVAEARRDLVKEGVNIPTFDPLGQGISVVMNQPIHADRLGLIYTRTFNALKGVDQEMDKQISRVLAKGLAEGRNPNVLAREMNNRIDKIGITRSRLIARTEVVQTLNEAKLNEFEVQSTILGEEIYAKWVTALDDRVRPVHSERQDVIYTRDEALALLGDPNCRCALVPYIKSIHG